MTHPTASQQKEINRWLETLQSYLETALAAGKSVTIVAVSRKMPRFLEWILDNYLPAADKEKFQSLLEKCDLTTERALPFLYRSDKFPKVFNSWNGQPNYPEEDRAIVVIDDSSLTGNTLSDLHFRIENYAGATPDMAVVFLCKLSQIYQGAEFYKLIDGDTTTPLSPEELLEDMKFVSEANRTSFLPIDLEFPILYFNSNDDEGASLESIRKRFDDGSKEKGELTKNFSYTLDNPESGKAESLSLIVNDDFNAGYNNDFAKIRVFSSGDELRLAAYCPNVQPRFDLTKPDLFRNNHYSEIWKIILDSLQEGSDTLSSTAISLTAAANYLHSLSFFNRNRNRILPDEVMPKVKLRDLAWIFGTELAKRILPLIQKIVDEKIVSPTTRRRFPTVPDMIVPEDYKDVYVSRRTSLLFDEAKMDINHILTKIFNLSDVYGENSVFDYALEEPDYDEGNIYESFVSLADRLAITEEPRTEIELKLHKWIDRHIDNGTVIPRYITVYAGDGEYCKRYFTYSGSPYGL